MPSENVFALSIHADYRCRHSGQCCTVDWDVPVELQVYRSLTEAIARGRLQTASGGPGQEPFMVDADLPENTAAILGRTPSGTCVFFDGASHLCVVHRDLGEPALAATCRHFPRIAIRDRRGTFVNLSHFCPTAAAMLFRTDVPLGIVRAPRAFPDANYDGMSVADDDYPPLLHPRMLMDHDGYSAWEAHMVGRCLDSARLPESVLATLTRDAERLARWRPGTESLREAVAGLPRSFVDSAPHESLAESRALQRQCLAAVPPDLRSDPDDDGLDDAFEQYVVPQWRGAGAPVNRYIAAKAFASWTAYQGRGIRTIVRGIEAAVALVRVEAARQCRDGQRALDDDLLLEAFRSADFILNHQAAGDELAEQWGRGIGEY